MIKGYTLTLVLTVWYFKAYSQNIILSGKVIDRQSIIAVQNANITFYAGARILYNTTSDTAGVFKVLMAILKQTGRIKISSVNYNELTVEKKSINYNPNNKEIALGVFKIELRKIELQEVKVKSKRRYRDTTRIDLSKEKFERSIMIEDIFSKNFGFSRDASGQLYYKGKPVSNILVNGGDFFGKNNLDIYHLLPALILSRIDVVETNIDSTTNTTMLRPTVSINLNLKDKYDKGKFGNANLGAGSASRYVANTDLYTYRNKEQLSLSINSNNVSIDDNSIQDAKVSFSANGNNADANSAKLGYRNVFSNKITVDLTMKAKDVNTNLVSESYRQDGALNVFSKIFNSSNSRSFSIENSRLNVNYQLDSLTVINASETFNHSYIKSTDSSNYSTMFNSLAALSKVLKQRNTILDWLNTKAEFVKKFGGKRGRQFDIDFNLDGKSYHVNELDNIFNTSNQMLNTYFIQGKRAAKENNYAVNSSFTEPINEDGYINFFVGYEKDKLNYNVNTHSDTTISGADFPSVTSSTYIKSGIKFQQTFSKVSFMGKISGIFNSRKISYLQFKNAPRFFNFNVDLVTDYKISSKKSLTFGYYDLTEYPDIQQLTSLNSTFDILSQNSGNVNLKPEEKKSIKLTYTTKPSDSETIGISGELDHFDQKFGISLTNSGDIKPGEVIENAFADNVGKSNEAQLSVSVLKNISNGKYLNFSSGLSWQNTPVKINSRLISNNGLTISQSLSTSFVVIKSLLSVSPVLAASYSKFSYEANSFNVTTVDYSDSFLITTKILQISLYPLLTYNHSINSTTSFSMNGGVKRSFFKEYCAIWLQAYDIFNSFKYVNNYASSSGYGSVNFNNLNRYFLLGVSLKFNNMK